MARDDKKPLTFILPDGDDVSLITWQYVVSKLEESLGPVLDKIELINESLTMIDEILYVWTMSE